jgi:hypothetical protein
MRKLRVVGAGVLACLLTWMLTALLGVLPRIPAEQRDALARLRAEPGPFPGRNATLYAWLIDRDVADADWPGWLGQAEAEAQAGLAALPAAAPWPKRFDACIGAGRDCLARVAAAPGEARALRDAQADRLRRIAWVQRETRHVESVGPPHLDTPLPPLSSLHAPVRLDVALRFLEGDPAGALQQLCRHAQWWRAARLDTDLLFVSGLGARVLAGAAESYAEMLSLLPQDAAPPAECTAAFAPLADAELDLCRPMRGEFLRTDATLRDAMAGAEDAGALQRAWRRLAFHAEATSALQAPAYDYWCSAAQRAIAASRGPARGAPPGRCDLAGTLFNYAGCALAQHAAPTLPAGYDRVLDLDGRLRLVASAAWLRTQPAVDAATFAQRPAALRDARHAFEGPRCAPSLRYAPRAQGTSAPPWRLRLRTPPDCPEESVP